MSNCFLRYLEYYLNILQILGYFKKIKKGGEKYNYSELNAHIGSNIFLYNFISSAVFLPFF